MLNNIDKILKEIQLSIKNNFLIDSMVFTNEIDNSYSVVIQDSDIYFSKAFRLFAAEIIEKYWGNDLRNISITCDPGFFPKSVIYEFYDHFIKLENVLTQIKGKGNNWVTASIDDIGHIAQIQLTHCVSSNAPDYHIATPSIPLQKTKMPQNYYAEAA